MPRPCLHIHLQDLLHSSAFWAISHHYFHGLGNPLTCPRWMTVPMSVCSGPYAGRGSKLIATGAHIPSSGGTTSLAVYTKFEIETTMPQTQLMLYWPVPHHPSDQSGHMPPSTSPLVQHLPHFPRVSPQASTLSPQ